MKINIKSVLQLAAFALMFQLQSGAQSIAINEVLTSNNNANVDEDGDHQDWVELFNYGNEAVNLEGFGLTDDPANPHKWQFPAVTMQPGSYLLVWCSDKNRTNPSGPMHTNFKISASGEAITLTDATQAVLDQAPAMTVPEDQSYGRFPDGTGAFVHLGSITPLGANAGGTPEVLPEPDFSHEAGFYTTSFTLTLSTNVPGASIIYTLDGSEPDAANIGGHTYTYRNQYAEMASQTPGPMLSKSYETINYSAPITIVDRTEQPNKLAGISSTHHFAPHYFPSVNLFKGTVVRAKVVKPGSTPGPAATRSYFVTPAGSNQFSLPVMSISLNEDRFFDYNDGIFVAGADFDAWREANPTVDAQLTGLGNFQRSGDESERAGHVDYFVEGQQVLSQDIGIRVNGAASRAWQHKSLRLVARNDYGDNDMDYQFFKNEPLDKFNRLILRSSGNDFFSTMYRDALAQSLISDFVETQAYQPTVTFVNGEYWGIHNIRERYDKFYFKNIYDIDEDELDLLEGALTPSIGDVSHWQAMAQFMENNTLATGPNFDYIATQLDVDRFRDYYIANIFMQNTDWPGWNMTFWRKRSNFDENAPHGHDGRWRPAMRDTDMTFGLSLNVNDHNTLEFATEPNGPDYPNPPFSTLVLRSLLTNEQFKINFINRFADLMNTYLKSERIIDQSQAMKDIIEPEIQNHLDRWKGSNYGWWNESVNIMHNFAQQRPGHQRDHIRAKFGIANNINAVLDVSNLQHGHIKINTIDITASTPGIAANSYPWTGVYFSNIPITLKAIPAPGYVFSHWTGKSVSNSPEIVVNSAQSFAIMAHFIPDPTPAQSEPVYFWLMDNTLQNDTPLVSLPATFEQGALDAVLNFESALEGYPFTPTSSNWRKASMERRNEPTAVNYIPEANDGIAFNDSDMRGIQIKEPLHSASAQNTLVFDIPTSGYKDVIFSFAAKNEQTNASAITMEYATSAEPVWTSAGITHTMPLGASYEQFTTDFTGLPIVNHNPHFRVRLRFAGENMDIDNGNRVTFNNISVHAREELSVVENPVAPIFAFPNPATNYINISGILQNSTYTIYTIDGRIVKTGVPSQIGQIPVSELSNGVYLLRIASGNVKQTIKIIKQ